VEPPDKNFTVSDRERGKEVYAPDVSEKVSDCGWVRPSSPLLPMVRVRTSRGRKNETGAVAKDVGARRSARIREKISGRRRT